MGWPKREYTTPRAFYSQLVPLLFVLLARRGHVAKPRDLIQQWSGRGIDKDTVLLIQFFVIMVLEFGTVDLRDWAIERIQSQLEACLMNSQKCAEMLGYTHVARELEHVWDSLAYRPTWSECFRGLGMDRTIVVNKPKNGSTARVTMLVCKSTFVNLDQDGKNALLPTKYTKEQWTDPRTKNTD
ncbi:hypothetical protein BJ085DRAFT_37024 [Dimargaris cristalligena]|uniref:Uncharacterized protein n=1 Tax=Dimargaris cristalligena TaxID=215637 RepID=A0A4V1J3V5_9FUNG|nr:hypothetical protein BJ085DRAFT_37024 [Dimargaris cristalligena]|eukprot:RKP33379.1 hypothetical protein BJ085DRAFT_37024 [Dimargaris cristalligena]